MALSLPLSCSKLQAAYEFRTVIRLDRCTNLNLNLIQSESSIHQDCGLLFFWYPLLGRICKWNDFCPFSQHNLQEIFPAYTDHAYIGHLATMGQNAPLPHSREMGHGALCEHANNFFNYSKTAQ